MSCRRILLTSKFFPLLQPNVQLVFQYFTVTSCDFFTLSANGDSSQLPASSFGIFYVEDTDGVCNTDQAFDPQGDGYVTGARNTLVLSMIFGFGALCLVAFEWICCKICCAGCIEGLAFAAAWILGWYVRLPLRTWEELLRKDAFSHTTLWSYCPTLSYNTQSTQQQRHVHDHWHRWVRLSWRRRHHQYN